MKYLRFYFKKYRLESLLAPLFKMLEACFDLAVPIVVARIINIGIAQGDRGYILTRFGILGAMGLLGLLCSFTAQWFSAKAATGTATGLRHRLLEKIQSLSLTELDGMGVPTLITRMTSDINQVQSGVNMVLRLFLRSPFIVFGAMIMAFTVNVKAALVFVVAIPLLSVVVFSVMLASIPLFKKVQSGLDSVLGHTRENLEGARVIRAFNKEHHEERRLDEVFSDYAANAIKVNHLFVGLDSSSFFLMNIAEVAVLWVGGNRVGAHAMQIASISAVLEYAILILFFVMMAQMVVLTLPRAAACLNRAQQVLEIEPSIVDGERTLGDGTPASEDDADAVAVFDHMSFRFDDADEDTLCDLSFACRRGQTTAIVGSTGSGKSTVAKLLLRFHDATKGAIRLDGIDLRELSQDEIRGRIAYVPQKAWLFSGTVASNLRFGNEDATEADMLHALQVAQSTFVLDQPRGLDTPVAQGGTNFSGGQRQRLAIARALMKHADLYIFDDSFSALDFKTDAALRHALQDETRDAAVLIIAQRISTILHADQIVVLKDGEVVGLGAHEELMETCEVYRAIAESQMKGGE